MKIMCKIEDSDLFIHSLSYCRYAVEDEGFQNIIRNIFKYGKFEVKDWTLNWIESPLDKRMLPVLKEVLEYETSKFLREYIDDLIYKMEN
jgi:hypothetical protein